MSADIQTAEWRAQLKNCQEQLQNEFFTKKNTSKLLKSHAKLVDEILKAIWQASALNDCALIAVGGYGRGELFPHSDVDLLILLPEAGNPVSNQKVERLIGLLWDVGLAVGHSVRTLDECIEEATKDVTVQTNLIESRRLAGNRPLFKSFQAKVEHAINVPAFLKAKIEEQEQRHKRFNDTTYNLEPNIKESPGGLRDLQTILWLSRASGLGSNWNALVKSALITASELRQIRRHEQHLQTLRIHLHYMAKRREDRLIFDLQNGLAEALGFSNHKHHRASEQLMHAYYRSAKFVSLINEILLQSIQEIVEPQDKHTASINSRFESRNGLLYAKTNTLLQREPASILEVFLLLQKHPELRGISADLLRTLQRVKKLINRNFRQDAANKATFIEILKQPHRVTDALRKMSRYGVLGRYIPAFGRIAGQMQHDLFHVYTVDEHTLNVLSNLQRFSIDEHQHEFPLCSKLFSSFDAPHLLYLGALFHDIAKGRGGDHSKLGMLDAKRFCRLHGLSKADSDLVTWLVGAHLLMSSTAQKSDLSDPQVIENFAQSMRDERHLIALYLLTVADIRGTSPKVWNAWKAKLLETLFLSTQRLLSKGSQDIASELEARQTEAQGILSHYSILEHFYQPLWDKLGRQYFLRHTAQEIAWHTRLLLRHINTAEAIVRARLSPMGDGIQVMIYTLDRDDLFAHICGFFERMGYNILEAKIHTSNHGYALDSFLIQDHSDRSIMYRDLLSYIEHELANTLNSVTLPLEPLKGRVSRQVKHMPIPASIDIKKIKDSNNHLLEIVASDRPGLLSTIAQALIAHQVHLQTAKINTLGNRAEDTFLISGENGSQLTEAAIIDLKVTLNRQIS